MQYKMLDKQIQKHQKDMQKQTQKYENHDDGIETTLQLQRPYLDFTFLRIFIPWLLPFYFAENNGTAKMDQYSELDARYQKEGELG